MCITTSRLRSGLVLQQRAMADRAHVIECVDPRDWSDWRTDFRLPTSSAARLIPSFVYFGTWPAASPRDARTPFRCRRGFSRRRCIASTGLPQPQFVPMPFDAPARVEKSPSPLVVFVGRLVRANGPRSSSIWRDGFRLSALSSLAAEAGLCRRTARRQAAALANLTFTDFIDQSRRSKSVRLSFPGLDPGQYRCAGGTSPDIYRAAAHGCAILSERQSGWICIEFRLSRHRRRLCARPGMVARQRKLAVAGERGHLHVAREHVSGDAIKSQLSVYEEALARAATRAARAFL